MSPLPHDDDRCARLYRDCKRSAVGYARRLLASSDGRNRHLAAFDAEEFYDAAWVTYYERREYLDIDRDHVACLNALILSRFRDERRRSRAQKRRAPGEAVDFDEAGQAPATGERDRVADRDELRRLLAQVTNPDDARALFDHEVLGLSFAEIGHQEGITAEAARRRAQRASRQARDAHEEDDHD
jgi:RNA polymerase sigma factor (sigma-70 family)